IRRHEDENRQPRSAGIADAVVDVGGSEDRVAGTEGAALFADAELAFAFQDEVDLVGASVRVRLLRLPRLEAVDVAEHPGCLEQVDLLHLLGAEPLQRRDGGHVHQIGSLPSYPVSTSCQNCTRSSDISQQSSTSRPSRQCGKSTSPRSKSL